MYVGVTGCLHYLRTSII